MKEKYPIFVVNLKRSVHRKKFMQEQLVKFKKPFQFIEAVDGRSFSDEEAHKMCVNEKPGGRYPEGRGMFHKRFGKGALGCYLSHLKIWKKMVKENIGQALVLEDDIKLNMHFFDVLDTFIQRDKEYISYINLMTDIKPLPFGEYLFDVYKSAFFIHKIRYALNRTSAYFITLDTVKKLLENSEPIARPVDDYISDYFFNTVGTDSQCRYPMGVYPPLVVLESFGSDIWDEGIARYSVLERSDIFSAHQKDIFGVIRPDAERNPPLKQRLKNKFRRILKEFKIYI